MSDTLIISHFNYTIQFGPSKQHVRYICIWWDKTLSIQSCQIVTPFTISDIFFIYRSTSLCLYECHIWISTDRLPIFHSLIWFVLHKNAILKALMLFVWCHDRRCGRSINMPKIGTVSFFSYLIFCFRYNCILNVALITWHIK